MFLRGELDAPPPAPAAAPASAPAWGARAAEVLGGPTSLKEILSQEAAEQQLQQQQQQQQGWLGKPPPGARGTPGSGERAARRPLCRRRRCACLTWKAFTFADALLCSPPPLSSLPLPGQAPSRGQVQTGPPPRPPSPRCA
jgi:hypothetical protein